MSGAPQGSPLHWPLEDLWQQLAPLWPGLSVELLPEIDSTNTELMRRARSSASPEPQLLIAQRQSAGRGRLGKSWSSQPGQALTFSLGLPLAPRDWAGLSLAVGLALAESLHPAVQIKWPNDLWLDGARKLCGILIETASTAGSSSGSGSGGGGGGGGGERYCVVGVGLNISAPPDEGLATPAASLQELLPGISAGAALLRIAAPLLQALQAFALEGFAPLQERFAARDLLRARAVRLSDGRQAWCEGVAADGALLLRDAAGLQALTSASVSVRPI